jgi:hypothetical protein
MDEFLELQQLSSIKPLLENMSLDQLREMNADDVRLDSLKPFHRRKLVSAARSYLPTPLDLMDTQHSSYALFGSSLFEEPLFPSQPEDLTSVAIQQQQQQHQQQQQQQQKQDILADEWCSRCGAKNLRGFRFCGNCGASDHLLLAGSLLDELVTSNTNLALVRDEDAVEEQPTSAPATRPAAPDWKQVAMKKKAPDRSTSPPPAAAPFGAVATTLPNNEQPLPPGEGVLVRLPPHTRSKADDDLLRRHV